jgi:hypothetical protein
MCVSNPLNPKRLTVFPLQGFRSDAAANDAGHAESFKEVKAVKHSEKPEDVHRENLQPP